ncbi:hypothetical protein MN116_008291 [Schistosoma mekongi]|uniref:Calponin-homology (CH) domain-containing protein n=1 Tax=Schistosoma mekongi TaxID=38744 RepID=A0AAE1Z784_SCHME|nr:hypothetical protein MN116_008291 [Schistosoma mekongi]
MSFTGDNTDDIEYNLLKSSCTTTAAVDGIYSDETESMINHARSSPMNASVDTTTTTTTTTPPLTSTRTSPDYDDGDEYQGDYDDDINNDDTNSHTTIDDDLMNSYAASVGTEDNDNIMDNNNCDQNGLIGRKDISVNSAFSMKKSEKQVTFQDVVEITTIYSIINDSQESIPHQYEGDDDEQEEKIGDSNKERSTRLFRKIVSEGKEEGSMISSPDDKHILSEKDLLNLYTDWANHYLVKANYSKLIKNIKNDLSNGLLLADIIHAVANIKVQRLCHNPKTSAQSLHNVSACFQVLQLLGIKTDGFTAQDIVDSKLKYILGLFFNLSKFKQETRKSKQSQIYTSTSSLTTLSTSSSSPISIISTSTISSFNASMNKLKSQISNENDKHYKVDHQHQDHHHQQSTPPKPPPRILTNSNNSSSPSKQIQKFQTNSIINDSLQKYDITNSINHSNKLRTNHLSLNKQENTSESLVSNSNNNNNMIGQLNSSTKNVTVTLNNGQCSMNPLTLNTNQYGGINASLNFTKPNVTSLRFPSSISLTTSFNTSLPSSPNSSTCSNKLQRQSIPRGNNLVNVKITQKSNQLHKKSCDNQNINNHIVNSDINNNNNNNNNLSTTKSNKCYQKTLTTSTLSPSSTGSIISVTATSPTIPSSLSNICKQQQNNSNYDVCDSTITTTIDSRTDDLQRQNSLSEHKSAPVGISYSNKSNISQFKASSFERSKLKSVSGKCRC